MNSIKIILLNILKELKISPNKLNYIFITYFHWDHIEGLIDQNDNIIYKNAKIYFCKVLLDKIKKMTNKLFNLILMIFTFMNYIY